MLIYSLCDHKSFFLDLELNAENVKVMLLQNVGAENFDKTSCSGIGCAIVLACRNISEIFAWLSSQMFILFLYY